MGGSVVAAAGPDRAAYEAFLQGVNTEAKHMPWPGWINGAALCFVAVCAAKAARAAATNSPPPVQWVALGVATLTIVIDNAMRTLKALQLARGVVAVAQHILESTKAEAQQAAQAAAAQLASERLVWEAELLEASMQRGRNQPLMLAVKDELNNLMDERERNGYQRFVSAQEYRRVLERHGLIWRSQHVCHIIASANGGADHPNNYAILGDGWNTYSRHMHDDINCFLVGADKAKAAVEASRKYGNRKGKFYEGPDGPKLVANGARKLKGLLAEL